MLQCAGLNPRSNVKQGYGAIWCSLLQRDAFVLNLCMSNDAVQGQYIGCHNESRTDFVLQNNEAGVIEMELEK